MNIEVTKKMIDAAEQARNWAIIAKPVPGMSRARAADRTVIANMLRNALEVGSDEGVLECFSAIPSDEDRIITVVNKGDLLPAEGTEMISSLNGKRYRIDGGKVAYYEGVTQRWVRSHIFWSDFTAKYAPLTIIS